MRCASNIFLWCLTSFSNNNNNNNNNNIIDGLFPLGCEFVQRACYVICKLLYGMIQGYLSGIFTVNLRILHCNQNCGRFPFAKRINGDD